MQNFKFLQSQVWISFRISFTIIQQVTCYESRYKFIFQFQTFLKEFCQNNYGAICILMNLC